MMNVDIRAEAPAEVWCSRCPDPAESVIDGEPYCHEHMLDLLWRQRSPSWAGSPERHPVEAD